MEYKTLDKHKALNNVMANYTFVSLNLFILIFFLMLIFIASKGEINFNSNIESINSIADEDIYLPESLRLINLRQSIQSEIDTVKKPENTIGILYADATTFRDNKKLYNLYFNLDNIALFSEIQSYAKEILKITSGKKNLKLIFTVPSGKNNFIANLISEFKEHTLEYKIRKDSSNYMLLDIELVE